MARTTKDEAKGGCFVRLFLLFLFLVTCGIGVAFFFIIQPQDLSDVLERDKTAKAMPARDLKVVMQNSIERGYPVTIPEAELNQWLGRKLVCAQRGGFEDDVSLDRVLVRIDDSGRAEVIMVRSFMGHPFTVSMYIQILHSKGMENTVLLHGGPFHESLPQPVCGGRFGKLPIPQGFLLLVLPAYERLAEALADELKLACEEMALIKFEDGSVILYPRVQPAAGSEQPGLPF